MNFQINVMRMAQKFLTKKNSVGYSHLPIISDDKVYFDVFESNTGRVFRVSIAEVDREAMV